FIGNSFSSLIAAASPWFFRHPGSSRPRSQPHAGRADREEQENIRLRNRRIQTREGVREAARYVAVEPVSREEPAAVSVSVENECKRSHMEASFGNSRFGG